MLRLDRAEWTLLGIVAVSFAAFSVARDSIASRRQECDLKKGLWLPREEICLTADVLRNLGLQVTTPEPKTPGNTR